MLKLPFALCGLALLGGVSPAYAQPVTPPPTAPIAPRPLVETPDYAGARWEPAAPTNFQPSDRPSTARPIDRIVIHDIEGTALSAVRWFQNPQAQVSSHYVVGADGIVYQQVKERDIAWHAGDRATNARAIGIEHEGFAYRPGFFTPVEYDASARLARQIALRYNIPRDREHIIGHFEVPDSANPGHFGGRSGHTDPGPYWDWDSFMMRVRNNAAYFFSSAGNGGQSFLPLSVINLSVTLRPGETQMLTVDLSNTGDDIWPADLKAEVAREMRQTGPVYLGIASGTPSAYYGPGWISPLYVVPAADGDVEPERTGRFIVPLHAPLYALGQGSRTRTTDLPPASESFRLMKVPTAPRAPVAFGPTVKVQMHFVPWEIAVSAPLTGATGWKVKETPNGMRTVWRDALAEARAVNPVRWQATLPLDGYYDVYARSTPGANRTKAARYTVTGADGAKSFIVNQKQGGETWRKLGRVRFAAPPAIGRGVRPGQPVPAPPPVIAAVELSGAATAGIIAAGDVRFVGPFAPAPL